ncbi:MAG: isoprenylcysteine carboxylmethyltransferase family protein [Flavobacteriaceae bacterium]
MELKIPPALVFVCFGILMYLLAEFLPIGHFDFFGRGYLMKALVGMAMVIGLLALIQFFRAKTTADAARPNKTSSLVTNGIYRYSRNPMYLALLMVLLAWGLYLGNAFNTLVAAGFVGYMNRFQISAEEKALAKLFGKAYQQYCVNVRRWF